VSRALARLRRRLAAEDGFTVTELLVGCVVGTVVLLSTFQLFDAGQRANARTQDRIDVQQRVRPVVQQIVRELRSQTCLGVGKPAIVQGDGNSITFYADLGQRPSRLDTSPDQAFRPDKRRLVFAGGTLTEEVYEELPGQSLVFSSTPTRTRVLLRDVSPVGTTPYLRYFSFTGAAPITPSVQLPVPLSTGTLGDAGHVVEIGVSFAVRPEDRPSAAALPFESYVYARTADPLDPTHSPLCL
jgi:hypothetical protein